MAMTHIVTYTGKKETVTEKGKVTGIEYTFGTGKKTFWADPRDVPDLLKSFEPKPTKAKKDTAK